MSDQDCIEQWATHNPLNKTPAAAFNTNTKRHNPPQIPLQMAAAADSRQALGLMWPTDFEEPGKLAPAGMGLNVSALHPLLEALLKSFARVEPYLQQAPSRTSPA